MRTLPELTAMIELTQADYLRDVTCKGRKKARYFEGMLVGLLFASGRGMIEAHQEIDRILAKKGQGR